MAELLFQSHINLDGNELQNAVVQNLTTAPQNPKAGQFYFNTISDTLFVYDGTKWVDALSQGDYTFINGLEEGEGRTVGIKLAATQGNVAFTADANGLAASVAAATTSAAGVVEFATDAEFTTGTSETLVVNPKQVNDAIADFIKLDSLSVVEDVGESGALTYDSSTGEFHFNIEYLFSEGLKIENTTLLGYDVTDGYGKLTLYSSTIVDSDTATVNAVPTTGAVYTAITSATSGMVTETGAQTLTNKTIAAGSNTITGLTAGNFAAGVVGTVLAGTATASNTVLPSEKAVADALAGATTGMVTETGAQTLTNKTIDAGRNSISNLEIDNFRSSTIAQIIRGTALASESKLATEKAVSEVSLKNFTIEDDSTNYLVYTYDASYGYKIGAKVDTTVTANSTKLVTSGAVATAIDNALVGGVIYKGTWAAAGQSDYSGITLPVKQGYMYYVSSGEDVTIDGITWNAGDYLLVKEDVAVGGTITSAKVTKIDNTEASDIVRTNASQTITNKTIDADDNTISDLTTGNFKSGVVKTVLAGTATAADTVLVSEKAIANALATAVDGMVTETGAQTLTNKTISADSNTISDLETDNFKAGVVQTTVRDTATASDTALASEKAIAAAVAALPHKFTATNGALTEDGGVCTWTIANSLATADVDVYIYRVSDGAQVMTEIDNGAANIVVKFNSAADIDAGAYKAVVIG